VVTSRENPELTPESLASPLLETLNDMAVKYLGLRLVIVFPSQSGMNQIVVGKGNYLADFCKLIQSNKEGAEHCRMCHLMMSQASKTGTDLVKRCHTGVSSLSRLVPGYDPQTNLAILTSCTLVEEKPVTAWNVIKKQGKRFGLDEKKLKKAHQNLHKLDPEKMELAKFIMTLAGDSLKLIIDKLRIESELRKERKRHTPDGIITSFIEAGLKGATLPPLHETGKDIPPAKMTTPFSRSPAASIIDTVSNVVANKPNLPFRLNVIAAACRVTPNHFSYLFHQHHKQCFSEFLTEQRLEMAKRLLKDLTLNVSQVASGAGFRDPGYFARRFKQKNGVSPREWRQRLPLKVP